MELRRMHNDLLSGLLIPLTALLKAVTVLKLRSLMIESTGCCSDNTLSFVVRTGGLELMDR